VSQLGPALGQIGVLLVLLAVTVPFLGRYLAHVYTSEKHLAVERVTYRVMRVDPDADQHWRSYAMSVLGFSLVGILLLFGLGRLQQHLPLSLGFPALPSEAAIGHLMQMSGLTVQNFVSAGVGMAVAAAFARGLARTENAGRVGNFFSDLVRTCFRVLLPISLAGAFILVLLGAVQNFAGDHVMHTITGASQTLTGGPVASQEAIKELGTNGGGFYNANSAHPFENPTPFTDLFEIYLLMLIPFAMAWAFGLIVKDRRQGIAIGSVMALLWATAVGLLTWAEMAAPGTAPQPWKARRPGSARPRRRCSRRPRPVPPRVRSTPRTTLSPPPVAA
jgi:K+-transporting ATPase ATPase A chain